MLSEEQQKQEYEKLLIKYLSEAEDLFGNRTDYERRPIDYKDEDAPETVFYKGDVINEPCAVMWLTNSALTNRKSGIFQLSHEVVHLLSPVEQNDGNEVSYLEEGMAVYLSKRITEAELGDYLFCNNAIAGLPHYYQAYMRFMSLMDIDRDAVKKIRKHQEVIGSIQPGDFVLAGLNVPTNLISVLLEKFDRSNGQQQIP